MNKELIILKQLFNKYNYKKIIQHKCDHFMNLCNFSQCDKLLQQESYMMYLVSRYWVKTY